MIRIVEKDGRLMLELSEEHQPYTADGVRYVSFGPSVTAVIDISAHIEAAVERALERRGTGT